MTCAWLVLAHTSIMCRIVLRGPLSVQIVKGWLLVCTILKVITRQMLATSWGEPESVK